MIPNGEEQNAYILGVDAVVDKFIGKIILTFLLNKDFTRAINGASDLYG